MSEQQKLKELQEQQMKQADLIRNLKQKGVSKEEVAQNVEVLNKLKVEVEALVTFIIV